MAATSADSSRLRKFDNFSISTDENTNRHVATDAGRSRKRKQTHTPRQEQEIGDCQFIEVVIPLGDCSTSGKTAESGEENNVMMTPPILPLPASPESATTSPVDDNKRTETVPSQEYHRSMPRRSKSKRRKRNINFNTITFVNVYITITGDQ